MNQVNLIDFGRRITRNAWRIPIIGNAIKREYEREFLSGRSRYRGVYPTFDAAIKAIPAQEKIGYDHAATAALYRDRMKKACQSDYGPLFWLQRILTPDSFVFDFGGHVGVSYHGWQRHLDYGSRMRWLVYDLPAITRVGEELAAESASPGLSFTNTITDGRGCSIFLTAGAIQYADRPLSSVLSELGGRLPSHLIVNKIPLYEGESFVTVQSAGTSFHPYHIYNRAEFVADITSLGYRVVDDWMSSECTCIIPFTKGKDIEAYSGYYFIR
jgi:putative methyltransferase (TIGR04325 family)